jgi:hypothetical protein
MVKPVLNIDRLRRQNRLVIFVRLGKILKLNGASADMDSFSVWVKLFSSSYGVYRAAAEACHQKHHVQG